MRKIFLFASMWCFAWSMAQYETVYFNYETSTFDENQPLPAEQNIMIRGNVSQQVQMVKVELNENKNSDKNYTAYWKRAVGSNATDFIVPFNNKLRSNATVDLIFYYYRNASQTEKMALTKTINDLLDAYVNQIYTVNNHKLSLTQSKSQIMHDMDALVNNALAFYENRNEIAFPGFSDLVALKLEQIENLKLKKAKFFFGKKDVDESKNSYRETQINELKSLVHLEVQQVLNNELFVLADTKFVKDYEVEKTRSTVALSAGYGGVFFGKTNGHDLDYGHAPYVGVSIPFGNKNFRKKFWHNLSADLGVFLLNFKDANNETISGPVIQRPLYAGLGYKFFRFVKLQAGYTLLEYKGSGGGFVNTHNIAARPYVGVGLQFNFWMDFAK